MNSHKIHTTSLRKKSSPVRIKNLQCLQNNTGRKVKPRLEDWNHVHFWTKSLNVPLIKGIIDFLIHSKSTQQKWRQRFKKYREMTPKRLNFSSVKTKSIFANYTERVLLHLPSCSHNQRPFFGISRFCSLCHKTIPEPMWHIFEKTSYLAQTMGCT